MYGRSRGKGGPTVQTGKGVRGNSPYRLIGRVGGLRIEKLKLMEGKERGVGKIFEGGIW